MIEQTQDIATAETIVHQFAKQCVKSLITDRRECCEKGYDPASLWHARPRFHHKEGLTLEQSVYLVVVDTVGHFFTTTPINIHTYKDIQEDFGNIDLRETMSKMKVHINDPRFKNPTKETLTWGEVVDGFGGEGQGVSRMPPLKAALFNQKTNPKALLLNAEVQEDEWKQVLKEELVQKFNMIDQMALSLQKATHQTNSNLMVQDDRTEPTPELLSFSGVKQRKMS